MISQHKKSSKYVGSVNCEFLDIERDPDGLYFHIGDFWSIMQGDVGDPEVSGEVVREHVDPYVDQLSVSLGPSNRESDGGCPPCASAMSGLPPEVSSHGSIAPNMVYTIPPPPSSVFYSREVIERARKLNLHPNQEHMRYVMAQSLTHNQRKHSSRSVFSKLRKLGAGKK